LELQSVSESADVLTVRSDTPTFGPQPFLALKTVTDQYYHDNFNFQVPNREWTYVFERGTLPLRAIEKIGVATNNATGVTTVAVLDTATREVRTTYWNRGHRP
jgi:hypothetical protein